MNNDARPTAAQERVIRQFSGDANAHVGHRPPTQVTYKICERNGWIEETETWPYHRATPLGSAALATRNAAC